jgi:hypothetical protein
VSDIGPGQVADLPADKLANELARVRQRGLDDLDKRSHNQKPVDVDGLAALARNYCDAHGLDLHGRIAQIRRLLLDALRNYGERGNATEADLIRDLLFDGSYNDDRVRPSSRKSPTQLLDEARHKHGPENKDRFDERRRGTFIRFATFLMAFVAERTSDAPSGPVVGPTTDVQEGDARLETVTQWDIQTKPRTRTRPALAAWFVLVIGAVLVGAGLIMLVKSRSLGAGLLIFAAGATAASALSTVLASRIERAWTYALGGFWRTTSTDLRGQWRSTYRFVSKGQQRTATQFMDLRQAGQLVFATYVGGSSPHRHFIRMTIDGDFVTGFWKNTVKGAKHHGVLQLRVRANGNEMVGRWIGFDSDAGIQEGEWSWERLQ